MITNKKGWIGGLVFVGVDGNSRWQFKTDRNNISPRIGGAHDYSVGVENPPPELRLR